MKKKNARQVIEHSAQQPYMQFPSSSSLHRFFLTQVKRGIGTSSRCVFYDAVNPILQQVVYGNQEAVRQALEAVSNNPPKLSALLSYMGTEIVKDYSGRPIKDMTLLHASASAGDVEMCKMLRKLMSPEAFAAQLAEIFPRGMIANEQKQKLNAFNFDVILGFIQTANSSDLDAALNKENNGSPLCVALENFRIQFRELSHKEKIFNPEHLLLAFELYGLLNMTRDCTPEIFSKKRDLFWRQIIGYTQRFVPACYAQALSQGLYYFPLSPDPRAGLGFDFGLQMPVLPCQACAEGRSHNDMPTPGQVAFLESGPRLDYMEKSMNKVRCIPPLHIEAPYFQQLAWSKAIELERMMLDVQSVNRIRP